MSAKDTAAVASAVAEALKSLGLANIPVAERIPSVTVTTTPNGKIQVGKTPNAKTEKRTDPRIPGTIIEVAKDSKGNSITLGYSQDVEKTGRDGVKRMTNYGFGVELEGTMIFHSARKWALLAQVAPIVAKAIAERYE